MIQESSWTSEVIYLDREGTQKNTGIRLDI